MENNSKPKRRWRLNIFDIVIIAVIITVAVVLIVLTVSRGDSLTTSSSNLRYTMELTNMVKEASDRINVGDELTDVVKKFSVGSVISYEITQTVQSVKDLETGEFKMRPIPDRYTATLVVESPATFTDKEITVGEGYVIRCGTSVSITGPGYAGSGYVISMERNSGK